MEDDSRLDALSHHPFGEDGRWGRDGPCGGGAHTRRPPRLGVRYPIEFLDADQLEGRGPLDGSQPVGEGGEAVEVVRRVVVVAARLMIAVVAVGAGYAVLLVVVAALLPLGSIPLAMKVVNAGKRSRRSRRARRFG